jgi:hypothetical protein
MISRLNITIINTLFFTESFGRKFEAVDDATTVPEPGLGGKIGNPWPGITGMNSTVDRS